MEKNYAVMVEGRQTPSKFYGDYQSAEKEAKRLTLIEKKTSYVLEVYDNNHDPEECKEQEDYGDYSDFDDDESEYTVWTCGCGTVVAKRPMGAMCPRCSAYMEEEPMW